MAVWNGILAFFAAVWAGIQNVFFTVINLIISIAQSLWTTFGGSIMTIFNGISNYFQGIWAVIKNLFLGAILLIIDLVTGNFKKLKSDAVGIFNNLSVAFGQIWTGIKQIFSGALQFIMTYITTVWSAIKNGAIAAWNAITSGISSAINGIKSAVTNGFNAAKNAVSNAIDSAKSFAINGFNSMVSSIGSIIGNVRSAISNGMESALSYLRGINLADIGRNIIQGLVDGIGSTAGAIGRKVKEIAKGIPEAIRKILGIASPSKVMKNEIGKWIPEGLADGIDSNTKVVKNATINMTKAAIPVLPENIGINKNSVRIVRSDAAAANNNNLPNNMQAKINIGGYEVTGLINFITTQQQQLKRQALNGIGGV
jgi:phage-related protein